MSNFILETLKLRFVPKEISESRREICATCPVRDNGICSNYKMDTAVKTFIYENENRLQGQLYNGCGCIIGWKTSLITEKCPLGKWDAEQLN